jgi:hypothetical protein
MAQVIIFAKVKHLSNPQGLSYYNNTRPRYMYMTGKFPAPHELSIRQIPGGMVTPGINSCIKCIVYSIYDY